MVRPFGLRLGGRQQKSVAWLDPPPASVPGAKRNRVIVYFADEQEALPLDGRKLIKFVEHEVPIIPVVPSLASVAKSLPPVVRFANAIEYAACGEGYERLATAVLEHLGILRSQRRVFLSYKRSESETAARQLHDALNAAGFDVFLDVYDVRPGADFQRDLLHLLMDSDVVVMLDTPSYFSSRWTEFEFGRASETSIPIVGVVWPGHTPERATELRDPVMFLERHEVLGPDGPLAAGVAEKLVRAIDQARADGAARRFQLLVDLIRLSLPKGGKVEPTEDHRLVQIGLPDGRRMELYPSIGVPTSVRCYDVAAMHKVRGDQKRRPLVAYSSSGIAPQFFDHLKWLDENLKSVGMLPIPTETELWDDGKK